MALSAAPPTFSDVFDIGPCHEALFQHFTHRELLGLRGFGNSELKALIRSYLARYPIRAADVAAGEHTALLRYFASVPGARLELPPGIYRLVAGDQHNVAHLLSETRPARARRR